MLFPIWWTIRWIVWEFLGIRAIWEKIRPPEPDERRRKPVTIGLWVTGFYVVFFGLVSNRYENKVNIINARATALVSQIISVQNPDIKRELAFNQIPIVQRMECPVEPDFWDPIVTIQSFIGDPAYHQSSAEMLRIPLASIMESEHDSLQGIVLLRGYIPNADLFDAFLSGADLSGTDLSGANLIEADLSGADFSGADLSGANLIEADLSGADFSEADLSGADLSGATLIGTNLSGAFLNGADVNGATLIVSDFRGTDFSEADLSGAFLNGAFLLDANFSGVNFSEADLSGALNLTARQLVTAKTLYGAQMDATLKSEVEKNYPELLEEPSEE